MKNKLLYIFLIIIFNNLYSFNTYSAEVFNFDVTELEIINEGNIYVGKKGGTATTEDGTVIKAKNFKYDKTTNILIANGDVEIDDKKENIIIYSQKITYFKNKELVLTEGKSKAINEGIIINADNFEYNKINNILNANGKVIIKDAINDYLILADKVTYFKNFEKIVTDGKTEAFIESRYIINSKDVTYLHNQKTLASPHKTKIKDQDSNRVYFTEKFNYFINQETIKGEEILIITNFNLPKSDKHYLKNAIIKLNNNKFVAKDTNIEFHKDTFNIEDNDPRIAGVSSQGDETYTLINKAIFTSCKKNDSCPAWSVKAQKIKHDRVKREIIYNHPIIRIYDIPVFYLPKFYHPDPSVKRKSGFLKPEINNSNVLGSSFTMPYFKVISDNKDLTITPVWYDTDTLMSSLEYRQENKSSTLMLDFAAVNNYEY